jgi:catechol 2,3-dioxygenase-like lactoylglutathione lyase family enzyme
MSRREAESVQGVDHIQLPIPVGALPKARAFYETLLGLKEVRDPLIDRPGSLHFSLGWQRLDLREGAYTGVAPQAHLGLRVRSLQTLVRDLTAAGHLVQQAPLPTGEARIFVEDPFGNRLELHEPAATHIDSPKGHRVTDIQLSI